MEHGHYCERDEKWQRHQSQVRAELIVEDASLDLPASLAVTQWTGPDSLGRDQNHSRC